MAKKGKHTNGRKPARYKTYNFVDKDPVIDMLRTSVKDAGLGYKEIEEASGVRRSTMKGWFHGGIRRPFHATAAAVAGACGKESRLVSKK